MRPYASASVQAAAARAAASQAGKAASDNEMMMAAREGDADKVAALLSSRADPRSVDFGGRTALMMAADAGSVPCMELLLPRSDIWELDRSGRGLWAWAISGESLEAFEWAAQALKAGRAAPPPPGHERERRAKADLPGSSAIAFAAWVGSAELMRAAEREGSGPEVLWRSSPQHPLQAAAMRDSVDCARAWLGMAGLANPRAACERVLGSRPDKGWGGSGEVEGLMRAFVLACSQSEEIAREAPEPGLRAPRRAL